MDQDHPLLSNALGELRHSVDRAESEGWPSPTPDCIARTERLLREMFDVQPHPYWIYPTPDAEMVIDAGGGHFSIVVTLFYDGGALYTYRIPGRGQLRAVECADSDDLPDHVMAKVLRRL